MNENKQKLFFFLCRRLGLNVDDKRKELCEKFNLESFADIRPYQLDVILDQLKEQYEQTQFGL